MRVRAASERDAASIARVWIRSWRQAYSNAFPPEVLQALSSEERTRQTLGTLARDDRRVFVGEVEGEIGGFAAVGPSEAIAGCGELYAIYLDAAHWGRGLAQALLNRAEDELRSHGFHLTVLIVLANNPRARRFYERNGWTAGETFGQSFFGHDVEVVRYRKELVSPDAAHERKDVGPR